MTEERMRDAFAWLRAHATDDYEAIDVLIAHTDLEQLASDLADICLLFIAEHGDPAHHIDHMFRAVELANRGRDEP